MEECTRRARSCAELAAMMRAAGGRTVSCARLTIRVALLAGRSYRHSAGTIARSPSPRQLTGVLVPSSRRPLHRRAAASSRRRYALSLDATTRRRPHDSAARRTTAGLNGKLIKTRSRSRRPPRRRSRGRLTLGWQVGSKRKARFSLRRGDSWRTVGIAGAQTSGDAKWRSSKDSRS